MALLLAQGYIICQGADEVGWQELVMKVSGVNTGPLTIN